MEQTATPNQWIKHVIDDNWTQVHAITLADIDGDGILDIVAGKRFMAHNGSDEDENGPAGVYWLQAEKGATPKWTKYAVTYNEGIGCGLNIVVVDLDGTATWTSSSRANTAGPCGSRIRRDRPALSHNP